jgi:hypothetical protein
MSLQDRSRRPNVLLVMTESHADLIPTLLGPAGIDQQEALTKLKARHTEAHPLVGRDISNAIRNAQHEVPSEAILFTTDDENSEGSNPGSPFQRPGDLCTHTRSSNSRTISKRPSQRSTLTGTRISSSSPATTTTSSSGRFQLSVMSVCAAGRPSP